MRVLFIVPPYPIDEFPALSTGTLYVASSLLREGHEVQVLDLLLSEATRDKVHKQISSFDPQLVGVTSVTMTFPMACRILHWVKEAKGEVVTVMGGPHVTFSPRRSLQECPDADVIVRGEAELTVVELAEAIERGKGLGQVKGLTYRANGETRSTPDRPLVNELEDLPAPCWDLLPLARYRALDANVGVLSSRGCPYGCIFCVGHRMVGRRGRFRRPRSVVDEMEQLASYGFRSIGIDDDLFTLNEHHAEAVCREITSRGLPITWHAFARVDRVSPSLLRLMARSGCTDICYGVESGCQRILDHIGKGFDLEQVRKAVRWGLEAGINVLASFILGLPGDTPETIRETERFARSLGCRYGFHVLAPFPGTRVRERASDYEIEILTDDWTLYDANRTVCLPSSVSKEDIAEVLQRYNRDLSLFILAQEQRAFSCNGDDREREQVVLRKTRLVAWDILRMDLVEKLGNLSTMRGQKEPLQTLAGLISEALPHHEPRWIGLALQKWLKEGILRTEETPHGLSFTWAENDRLREGPFNR